MATLNIQTGVKEYTLNEKVTVSFNPTDFSFIERLFETFDALDSKQEKYRGEIAATDDNRALFDITRRMDKEMRESIDELFSQPICDALLGGINIYALADGLPIWANILLAIMDEVDTSYAREQKATNPRVQKYLKKYKK